MWALARYDRAAVFLGIATAKPAPLVSAPQPSAAPVPAAPAQPLTPADQGRVAQLEQRLAAVERTTQMAAGSAGRADALVVAFAARRAIDRGVPLGFIENLLVDRFGAQHQRAVATVISAGRTPVRLQQLKDEYAALEPELRGGGARESWWSSFRRGFSSLLEIRHAEQPSAKPETRYLRASDRLSDGDVEGALAETMRLPGAPAAGAWVAKARRYVASHQALDELEGAALMAGSAR
ncbi:hypothetical protein G7077_06755 [Sphingomonas piscis]|uniref:Uncharacterized protein n=1 Tax=Sphingomonas piscis TaxID=2714943 RepID=A0A6G7YPH2_9SPHN|nr:hypothetical protein [Sphingomonas piscis]QIK78640.1 hypothetical protein G7077_06755 [Sphingomonas piscis]